MGEDPLTRGAAIGLDASLTRALGSLVLAAAIVNLTIGGSIFVLPGVLAASVGPAGPLVFVAGALLFVPITLCFAAAGSRTTATGGAYTYVTNAFGRLPGFLVAAIFWTSNAAGSGSMAAALSAQVAHVVPALAEPRWRCIFLFSVYAGLCAVNLRGIRLGAAAVMAFAMAKALPLLVLLLAGTTRVHLADLQISAAPSWQAFGGALVMVVFAYSGIETALTPSGEMRNPARVVPKAALLGVGCVVFLYVGLQTVAQGVLGSQLANRDTPLADLADVIIPGAGKLLLVTAALSLLGVLQGDLLGSSRLLYAMARDGFLPGVLARVSQTQRIPAAAVIVHALVGWLLASAGTFTGLALISGGAFSLVYIGSCAAAWQLQRAQPGDTRTGLRLPCGALIPGIAIAALLVVLSALTRQEWLAIVGAVLIVTALFGVISWINRRPARAFSSS